MYGEKTANPVGVYGSIGEPDPSNIPRGRGNGATAYDIVSNTLWLFGGEINGGSKNNLKINPKSFVHSLGSLNDLWIFDGSLWTWLSGSNEPNKNGIYGTQGIPSPSNTPGSRYCVGGWVDNEGSFWIFGGGYNNGNIMLTHFELIV
jgi:hypothetical protein